MCNPQNNEKQIHGLDVGSSVGKSFTLHKKRPGFDSCHHKENKTKLVNMLVSVLTVFRRLHICAVFCSEALQVLRIIWGGDAGEMAPQLKVLSALPENRNLVRSTPIGVSQTTCNSGSRASHTFFWPPRAPILTSTHSHPDSVYTLLQIK